MNAVRVYPGAQALVEDLKTRIFPMKLHEKTKSLDFEVFAESLTGALPVAAATRWYPLHGPRLPRVAARAQIRAHGGRSDLGTAGGGVARERPCVDRILRGTRVLGGRP